MINQIEFDKLMKRWDDNQDGSQDLGGIFNAVMDGADAQEFGHTAESLEAREVELDLEQEEIRKALKVPNAFMYEIFDSCIMNRWELYNELGRNK